MADKVQKVEVIFHYLDLKRKLECCINLKKEIEKAFEHSLRSVKRKKPRRRNSLLFRQSYIRHGSTESEQMIFNEELDNLNLQIQWIGHTADVTIKFTEHKSFNKTWFEKATLEFYRTQMMTMYHMI